MEAAHKAALAKGEVGIRDKVQVPTLSDFAAKDFLPFIDARFAEKRNTLSFYRNGVKNLLAFAVLGQAKLDAITSDKITGTSQACDSICPSVQAAGAACHSPSCNGRLPDGGCRAHETRTISHSEVAGAQLFFRSCNVGAVHLNLPN